MSPEVDFDALLGGEPPRPDSTPDRSRSPADIVNRSPEPPQATGQVSASDLAHHWGVTRRQVDKLVSEGVIVRSSRGRFDLVESTQRYIAHLIGVAKRRGTTDPELREEKLRLTREQADAVALKNSIARSELLDAAAVEREWSSMLTDIRAAMLAVPSRLPMLDRATLELVDREIRDALTEAAK